MVSQMKVPVDFLKYVIDIAKELLLQKLVQNIP